MGKHLVFLTNSVAHVPHFVKMSETALLQAFRKERSEDAFAELVRRYASLVYSVAKRRLNSSALAEDITTLISESRGYILLVADGVGGRPDGQAASGTVVKTIAHTGGERFVWLLPGLLCVAGILLFINVDIFYCCSLPLIIEPLSWGDDVFNAERPRGRTRPVNTRAELSRTGDDRYTGIRAAGRAQALDTEAARHVDVDDHKIHFWRRLRIVAGDAVHAISLRRQPFGQKRTHERVIFDNHNARHHRIRRADVICALSSN